MFGNNKRSFFSVSTLKKESKIYDLQGDIISKPSYLPNLLHPIANYIKGVPKRIRKAISNDSRFIPVQSDNRSSAIQDDLSGKLGLPYTVTH